MSTINILGMSEASRRNLIRQAGRELAGGDDRLARQLAVAAGRQFAVQTRHIADEVLTRLEALRRSLVRPQ